MEQAGARPVEIDTDGVYYVPPEDDTEAHRTAFRKAFAASLPAGIEIGYDHELDRSRGFTVTRPA